MIQDIRLVAGRGRLLRHFAVFALAHGLSAALSVALAHGDFHERIEVLTQNILAQPADADLYLQRAELERQHGEHEAALADLARAERLKPGSVAVAITRVRTLRDQGDHRAAVEEAGVLLVAHPDLADARVIRARSLAKLGRHAEAVTEFDRALEQLAAPDPDLFLERARAQLALGRPQAAVAGLEAGIKKLGVSPALVLTVVACEREQRNFTGALAHLQLLCDRFPRNDSWRALRAELLAEAGRTGEALQDYRALLADLRAHPAPPRRSASTAELERRVRETVTRLETKLAQTKTETTGK